MLFYPHIEYLDGCPLCLLKLFTIRSKMALTESIWESARRFDSSCWKKN
ncbi:MAG: hypothetical protein SOY88_01820 [Massilioclostridium sp.]|nr:hypothetical protein [Massilioclostridium sp.]